jgi:hypothetical protein
MTNTRSLVISISLALLSATPLVCAQDVKSSEAQLSLQRPAIIQELRLQPIRFFSFPLQADRWVPSWAVLSAAPLIGAQDVKTSEPKLSLQSSTVIRERQLQPTRFFSFPLQADPWAPSWAVLSAAPLIGAQDVKTSEPKLSPQSSTVIQELQLQPTRFLMFPLQADTAISVIDPQDLSRYRDFQLGMNLLAVAKQTGVLPSEVRVVYQRPALIQELEWRPQGSLSSSLQPDSVSEVLFSFYNGQLFRMVVNYDRHRTEGLTDEDMVEAISAKYGAATRPEAKIILFSSFTVYNDNEKVLARWEDSQYSFNLFRSSYQPTFGMLVYSKFLDVPARAAIVEAIRLDEQEAPQREIERQKQEDEANRAEQDAARLVNKAAFRL